MFDFGVEVPESGSVRKTAAVGSHEARLSGIVHLGLYEDTFDGKKKPAAPFVCLLFELKSGEDGGGVNDDGSPIIVHKTIALKKGDRATLTTFLKVMFTAEEFKLYNAGVLQGGLDDLIGRVVQLDLTGSKKLGENGEPAYVNVTGYAKLAAKFAAMVDELEGEPIGHVTLKDYTPEIMKILPPYEIYDRLEQSLTFEGSKAQAVLLELRKEDPTFGTKRPPKDGEAATAPTAPVAVPSNLDEDEDFA